MFSGIPAHFKPTVRGVTLQKPVATLSTEGQGWFGLVGMKASDFLVNVRTVSTGWNAGLKSVPRDERWRAGDEAMWELRSWHCNLPFEPGSDETHRILQEIWDAAFPGSQFGDVIRSE